MTVLQALFHPSTTGTEPLVIKPIADGRFSVTVDQSAILDSQTGVLYQGNQFAEMGYRHFTGIVGLTDAEIVSIPYLFALAVNPLFLPESLLRSPDSGPKVFFANSALYGSNKLQSGQVIWQYPDGGIESPIAGYKYVPFASKYAINNEGDIRLISTGDSISTGHNRDGIYTLELDRGDNIDIDAPNLMVLAFGKYNETNYLDEPVPMISDKTHVDYLKLSNWLKAVIIDTDKYVTGEDFGTRLIT